jgi:hypothetical protein
VDLWFMKTLWITISKLLLILSRRYFAFIWVAAWFRSWSLKHMYLPRYSWCLGLLLRMQIARMWRRSYGRIYIWSDFFGVDLFLATLHRTVDASLQNLAKWGSTTFLCKQNEWFVCQIVSLSWERCEPDGFYLWLIRRGTLPGMMSYLWTLLQKRWHSASDGRNRRGKWSGYGCWCLSFDSFIWKFIPASPRR